ncbi:hypothetical protein [Mitsuaria sp. 7]|uniref:hypothetical protein n=1 Tax=Mitsuaria sp. 7 TaxID=1658665 RepID=UPI0018D2A3D9|nr:hypothetical protein [Mitsuaria sp. 7]
MNTIPKPAERFPFPTSLCPPIAALKSAGGEPLPRKRRVPYGILKGQIRISDDFDAPLPDHLLAGFGALP